MNFRVYVLITILGMFLVTHIPRALPLLFFSNNKMNRELERFIGYFPISILTALVIKEIFFIDGQLLLGWTNPNLLPSLLTLLIGIWSKSIGLTIGSGIVFYSVMNIIL